MDKMIVVFFWGKKRKWYCTDIQLSLVNENYDLVELKYFNYDKYLILSEDIHISKQDDVFEYEMMDAEWDSILCSYPGSFEVVITNNYHHVCHKWVQWIP